MDFLSIWSALVSLSQKIHAKSTQKSMGNKGPIRKLYFFVFWLGAGHWFTSLQLDASISVPINQDLQA